MIILQSGSLKHSTVQDIEKDNPQPIARYSRLRIPPPDLLDTGVG